MASLLTIRVFVQTWKDLKIIRDDINFGSWLIGIAVYITREEFRSGILLRKINKQKKKNQPSPSLSKALQNPIEKFISKLETNKRMIIILHDIENYSLEEVADLTGSSISETKRNLVEIRRELIAEFQNEL